MGRRFLVGAGRTAMADDGIGLRVAEEIAARGLDRGFEVVDLSGDATRLLDAFRPETERILIVDALVGGRTPGDHVVFDPADTVSDKALAGWSTHEGDLLRTIELGRRLGLPVPPIRVLGIEPACVTQGMDLSETLDRRLEDYLATALRLIGESWS